MYGVYLLGIEGKDLGRSAAQSIILCWSSSALPSSNPVSNETVTYGA